MEHVYEEIKFRHHQKLRVPAAIIGSIMFSFLITVFLLMSNRSEETDDQTNEKPAAVSNTAGSSITSVAASN